MHYTERIPLATAVAKDGELCHFHAEQTFVEVRIDEEIRI